MSKFIVLLLLPSSLFAAASLPQESAVDEKANFFSGHTSRLNPQGRLMRIRTDFANIKFLNRKDRIEFWNESYPEQRCPAFVEGRTNEYLLLRVPQYDLCIRRIHFTTGTYLHLSSVDLKSTVQVARELIEILLKKRLAMKAKKIRHERELETHLERLEVTNKRFEILRQKLELEWKAELAALEEDRSQIFAEFKHAEARLNEIDAKLEAYRVEDHNLKLDRWSLDPALYIKK